MADRWKAHLYSELPAASYFRSWKSYDLDDINFAFGTTAKTLGAAADTNRAAKYASQIMRYLRDFKAALQEIAQEESQQ